MSDDWLKDFELDDEGEKPTEFSVDNDSSISLDSLGIPILEEVVVLEDDFSFDENISFDTENGPETSELQEPEPNIPTNEIQPEEISDKLKNQLEAEFEDIAEKAASQAVSNITTELEDQIKTQLMQILDQKLDELIDIAIKKISKDTNTDE